LSATLRPQHAEALAVGHGGSHGVAGGSIGIFAGLGGIRDEMGERGVDVDIAESGQTLARGTAAHDSRQAPFGIAAVLLEILGDESHDHVPVFGIKIAAGNQMIGDGPRFIAGPGLKGRDKLDLVNETILKREHAEEQVSRWVDSRWHHLQLPIGKSQRQGGYTTN
jgi:hypothetical protein